MEGIVVGFCVRVDGNISYLACPWCYTHLCHSYRQYNGREDFKELPETDSGSSTSELEQLDDAAVFSCLNNIIGSAYAQVSIMKDMWVSCSTFRELGEAQIHGRKFGIVADFQRLADELFWDIPSGLVVVNLEREKAIVFKAGQEPSSIALCSALIYLRRWAGMGLAMHADNASFFECHWYPGSIRTTIRRLMRVAVESWKC